jgi:hypothetical protein
MSSRDPSVGDMIEWISELDDPYKIWLFGLLNAIFAVAYLS